MGDAIAEEIGVFAEPEFYSKEITDDDQVLVLGSDGIFEFLSNQKVIDICTQSLSPTEACEEIVMRSYEEWMKCEDRVDDMTVIVLYFGDKLFGSMKSIASIHSGCGMEKSLTFSMKI